MQAAGHSSNNTEQGSHHHPNALKIIGSTNSAPNLLPVNPKKPLSRLLKSSPGTLVPPNTGGGKSSSVIPATTAAAGGGEATSEQQNTAQLGSSLGQGQAPVVGTPQATLNGLRAAFYRSISNDPRRSSNASQFGDNNNFLDKHGGSGGGGYSRRNSGNVQQSNYYSRHPHLTQMNSNSSSTGYYDGSRGGGREGLRTYGSNNGGGPKEPLPWCGCWGNGCI
jgi:hypothetical protein